MSYRIALSALLLVACAPAVAQSKQPITLGNTTEYRVSISAPTQSTRIGNAVLRRHHNFNVEQKYGSSAHVLVSCDGSWISTTFRDVFHYAEAMTTLEQEEDAKAKEEALDPNAIELTSVSTSEITFAEKIARNAQQYCKSAGREPKNSFIPVSRSAEENGIVKTTSIVTGTSAKVDGAIDIWMRTTEYKRETMLNADGKPIVLNGIAQKYNDPTGKYTMHRVAYDCRQRRMGTYELSIYEAGKVTPDSDSIPREKLRLSAVTPGTVGESQLDWVCALYGAPSN
jgi:hypothetical protein